MLRAGREDSCRMGLPITAALSERPFLTARLTEGAQSPVRGGLGPGLTRAGEGRRVQSLAQQILICYVSLASRSFHAEPEAGSGLPWACAWVWEEGPGTVPWEWRNAGGRRAGWWGPPSLPAWLPLLSHALPWLAALGWNKHRDAHRAQEEQHSPLSSADTGTTVPTGTATLHAGLCPQSRNPWATLFPFSNFSLVKWSPCWSCVFNLPDIEATTTSPSALSQHRKPIKTRKKHKLQTGRPRVAQGCCLQAVSYDSDSFQCELLASDKAKTERRLFTAF